jgi:hypothetical protein
LAALLLEVVEAMRNGVDARDAMTVVDVALRRQGTSGASNAPLRERLQALADSGVQGIT